TSAARPFLTPRLPGGVLNRIAAFLRAVAATCVSLIGNNDLVHQGFVELAAENGIGRGDRGLRLTLVVQELKFHNQAPFLADIFTAGRTITLPSLWPGTAPLTNRRPRSASTRTMSRFWMVRVTSPMWPVIFLPGNTRPGSWAIPMEPGTRWEIELPWELR